MAAIITSFIVSGAFLLVLEYYGPLFLKFCPRSLAHHFYVIVQRLERIARSINAAGGFVQDFGGSEIRKYLGIFTLNCDIDWSCKTTGSGNGSPGGRGGDIGSHNMIITNHYHNAIIVQEQRNGKISGLDLLYLLLKRKLFVPQLLLLLITSY